MNHIYKGEERCEDLSKLKDSEIWERLKNRIYDSSLTIVFISPNMKERGISERNQWIPWEVSYSLKEISRLNSDGQPVTSKTNAMLAVVLPDLFGSYSYFLKDNSCCISMCTSYCWDSVFFYYS